MCLCMFRRGFLKGAAVSPALFACQGSALEARAPAFISTKWIDVHCHVFNGRDLPIYEFIKKTRLNSPNPGDWIAAALVAFLAGGLQRKSPSAADELALLQSSSPRAVAAAPVAGDPVAGLKRLRARGVGVSDAPGVPTAPPTASQNAAETTASDGIIGAPRDAMAIMMLDRALRETDIRAPASA